MMNSHLRSYYVRSIPLFVMSVLGGLVLSATPSAQGHGAGSIFPLKWTADETYYVGNSGGIGQSNLWSASEFARTEWNATSAWFEIGWGGYQATGPFAGCSVPSTNVYLYGGLVDGAGGDVAVASNCGGGTLTRSSVIFDAAESWYTGSGTPAGWQSDLRSVAAHEFGHVVGFHQHWHDHDTGIDCSTSARETMCSRVPSGTTYMRSIQAHEEHTMENAYP